MHFNNPRNPCKVCCLIYRISCVAYCYSGVTNIWLKVLRVVGWSQFSFVVSGSTFIVTTHSVRRYEFRLANCLQLQRPIRWIAYRIRDAIGNPWLFQIPPKLITVACLHKYTNEFNSKKRISRNKTDEQWTSMVSSNRPNPSHSMSWGTV
jgi:hypothetical protein